jgi:regulatory protein
MSVISLIRENSRGNGTAKLEFSDGSSLIVSLDYLPCGSQYRNGEFIGRELSPAEEEALRFAGACCRAEKAAARLIARAEQSSYGLTAKLERRGFDAAAAKAVVSRLMDKNLLSDARFAELWLRSRIKGKKAPSPRWLLASLGKRGIDRDSSRKALDKVLDPETEYALLLKFMKNSRSAREKTAVSPKYRLKYEGFSPEAIEQYFS